MANWLPPAICALLPSNPAFSANCGLFKRTIKKLAIRGAIVKAMNVIQMNFDLNILNNSTITTIQKRFIFYPSFLAIIFIKYASKSSSLTISFVGGIPALTRNWEI